MKISVVVPVYGCPGALVELYDRLVQSIKQITEDYEIILVNDKCPYDSWSVIEKICNQDNKVKGIELARNCGQHNAIVAGLDYCSGDWVVVMDCDLQDRPEEIPTLYEKAMEGYDVVVASRKNRNDSRIKIFWSKQFYKLYQKVTNTKYDGTITNFSIVKKSVIDSYCSMREMHRDYSMYLCWLGYRRAVVEVQHDERFEGKSSYSFKKRVNLAFDILTSQSDRILRVTVSFGFVISMLAFFAIIGIVIYKMVGDVDVGWSSIIATIVLMGGLTIMFNGVIGIYVGNIFMESKKRPLYFIRQIVNDNRNEEL